MHIYIVYELRNREYDTVLLLKNKLEHEGYTVEVISKQMMFKWTFKNSIVIIPNCYNTENYDYYNYSLNARNNYIINLQIEQVISEESEKNGFFNPSGKATKAIHCCWGNDTYNRLKSHGITEENLCLTGAIHLDFLRPEFNDFWYSKEEIAKMFNLPLNKRWMLYISSFSYVNNEAVVNKVQESFGGKDKAGYIKDFEKLSTISQTATLEWLEQLILDDEDLVVIYRSHPAETKNDTITKLASKYKGSFFNISELNIKQWIIASDQIMTWFSTSIVESYVAKKNCFILRPYEIPKEIDAKIYHGATKIIKEYSALKEAVMSSEANNFNSDFPITKEKINQSYQIETQPAYDMLVELVNQLAVKDKREVDKFYTLNRGMYLLKNNIVVKYYIKYLYQKIYRFSRIKIKNKRLRKKWAFENLENEVDNRQFYLKDEHKKMEIFNIKRRSIT